MRRPFSPLNTITTYEKSELSAIIIVAFSWSRVLYVLLLCLTTRPKCKCTLARSIVGYEAILQHLLLFSIPWGLSMCRTRSEFPLELELFSIYEIIHFYSANRHFHGAIERCTFLQYCRQFSSNLITKLDGFLMKDV